MITTIFFFLLFTICIGLWISSLLILSKSKYFFVYIILNIIIIIFYAYLITQTSILNKETDPYGLEDILLLIVFLMSHSIIGFTFAKYYSFLNKKNVNK